MSDPSANDREQGSAFLPKFDQNGFLTAIAVNRKTGQILMVAHMNAEALDRTRSTGRATFFSRSRNSLWTKGESSGHFLDVHEILVDCDQDAIVLHVEPQGPACHTGATSCFYRRLEDGELVRI